MMCFIPTQKLEIDNINFEKLFWYSINPPKPITPLSYSDNGVNMAQLCIFTPFLKIKNIDLDTGRIQLDVSDQPAFLQKITTMQTKILQKINENHKTFFMDRTFTPEELRQSFQPLIEKNVLTMYIPYGRNDTIPVYNKDTGWKCGISNSIKVGDKVRVALKIYGISYQYIKSWTGRCRIQHQVFSIYKAATTATQLSNV